MAAETMLTTVDNPFNPFTQFVEWYAYDMAQGHDTLGYLARIVHTSDALSDADQQLAIDHAIAEIIEHNVTGMLRTVSRETSES